ncbi:MAG: hypothetical protein JWN60_2900 [Acidobacteria bacterium]|jgi:hypothetical protein|nr:hypothetical protein [Acidobacteriota bacterium]
MIRTFALIFGIIYIIAGIAGFIPALTPHTGDLHPLTIETAHGRALGLFPVNILHNIVHLAIGLWGVLGSRSLSGARLFARGLAIIYGLLAILGLIPGLNTMFGLVPIYGHDVWLHAGTALIAAYFGFIARSDGEPAASATRV